MTMGGQKNACCSNARKHLLTNGGPLIKAGAAGRQIMLASKGLYQRGAPQKNPGAGAAFRNSGVVGFTPVRFYPVGLPSLFPLPERGPYQGGVFITPPGSVGDTFFPGVTSPAKDVTRGTFLRHWTHIWLPQRPTVWNSGGTICWGHELEG